MDTKFEIQVFHDSGQWQALGAYQRMTLEKAMAHATEFAKNLYAWPLGLRVTGPRGFVSDRIGGRDGIELSHNPVTETWTGLCTKCTCTITGPDPYTATNFARLHQCEESGGNSSRAS